MNDLDPRARALISLVVSGALLGGSLTRIPYLLSLLLVPLLNGRGANAIGALVLLGLAGWSYLLVRGGPTTRGDAHWMTQAARVLALLTLGVAVLVLLTTLTSDQSL